jgi:Copper type II ascorbate-dependent monooxygenase, C-terminal domain
VRRLSGTGRLAIALSVAAALLVPLVAVAASLGHHDRSPSAAPSFQRDVAPILREKCTGCHQVGGIAPFSLETPRQAQKWAQAIGAAVAARIMPPWPPGPASPDYVGQETRQLTAGQRSTIVRWTKAGGRASGPRVGKLPAAKTEVRAGERLLNLMMPSTYRPRAKAGATDDYRCFLLDPKLADDAYATSASIVPGARSIVHHVILFRIAGTAGPAARRLDAASPGQGWSCFGGIGVASGGMSDLESLDNAPWISAWAPGWGTGRMPDGTGVPMPKGSLVVMQVHYNLLNGYARDRSRTVLTLAPASAGLEAMQTVLLPAPVELACVKGEKGRLCNRDSALADIGRKYGSTAAFVPGGLLFICGQNAANPKPSTTSTCSRKLDRSATIHAVAGHMHLLGKSIRVELNPGTANARVLLDIPDWNFHWQNAYTLEQAVEASPGDVLRVTCRYEPARRHHGGHGIPKTPRYVLWGEGTTDEMCLGLLQVTRG